MGKNYLLIGVLVLVAIVAVYFFLETGPSPEISLGASLDKTSYQSGEEVNLVLSINNSGEADTCVSDMAEGSIRFISFTRDGEPVETRSAPSYFIASYSEMLEAGLKLITPGESLEVVISGRFDPGLDKQAFRTSVSDGSRGLATFYDVETPGNYELELVYEYPGPSLASCPSVFRGDTNTVNLTFTVTSQ